MRRNRADQTVENIKVQKASDARQLQGTLLMATPQADNSHSYPSLLARPGQEALFSYQTRHHEAGSAQF